MSVRAQRCQPHYFSTTPRTYIHTHTHTYIHTYTHIHTHTCIHTYIHTCIHIYIYIYNTHTYIYTHTYIHTYMHTYIHTHYIHIYMLHRHFHCPTLRAPAFFAHVVFLCAVLTLAINRNCFTIPNAHAGLPNDRCLALNESLRSIQCETQNTRLYERQKMPTVSKIRLPLHNNINQLPSS